MSDDFEKAVLFSFDQSGAVGPDLRTQAQSYLQSAAAGPDAWQMCINRLESSSFAEVKFWCLQTLHSFISSSTYISSLDPSSRAQIKRSLVTLGAQPTSQLPFFLRNKVAQAIVAIAAQEYPALWPTFFQDMLGTLNQGLPAVDLFCRILVSIDEDIISLDVPRSAEGAKRSMHFKDAMRESALSDVASAWAQLVAAYKDAAPELVAALLEAIERYVHWIDIGLLANDTFVPLLYAVMDNRSSGGEENLQAAQSAAAGVLTEIVSKRMEAVPKLTLIQNLGLVPVCSQWARGLPGAEDGIELAVKYAKLLAALATEVLESWKKVENSVLSMEAVGLTVGEDAGTEATAACQSASALLDALFPAVLTALRTGNDEIAASVTPFLLTYIARVRMVQKRSGGMLPSAAAAQLPAVLEAVATCARFPSDSSVYGISAENSEEKVAGDEEEAAVAERRQELFTLFRNTAKLVPDAGYASVGRRLEASLSQGADVAWQDAELALSLAYQLGEGATEDALRPGSGPLAALATGIMRTDVPAVLTRHRLVALALLETCARYAKAAVAPGGQTLLPRVIGLFLGPTGLGHPSETVPPRAAYLLCRIVKTLRQQVHPLAPELLSSLRPHLATIAASPASPSQVTAEAGIKAAGASTQRGALGAGISAADDRLYAFEAAGLLIGDDAVPEEVQLGWMWTVFRPLMTQVGEATEVPLLQQALEGLTRASKGFALRVCEARPRVAAALLEPLTSAIRVLQRFPGQKSLRAKFLAYVHRLVECVGPRMTPHLPSMLWVLHQTGSDAADTADVLQLLNQSMMKLRGPELELFLRTAVPECVGKVHSCLNSDWDWSGVTAMPAMGSSPAAVARFAALAGPAPAGSTEDLRERAELQRSYYGFLNSLAIADLGGSLMGDGSQSLSGTDFDALRAALNDLACGASTHVDPSVRKICVATLGRLASDWLDTGDGGAGSRIGAGGVTTPPGKEKGGGPGADTPQTAESIGLGPASPPIAIAAGAAAHPLAIIPGISEFFLQRFGCEVLIEGLAAPGCIVDVRDAAAISLLTEVAVQLKAMHRLGGARFLGYLCGTTLPKLGWPAVAVEQLVAHITQSETKALKDFLKQALLELRQQQANGTRR